MQRVIQDNMTPEEVQQVWKYLDEACSLIAKRQTKSLSYQDLYQYAYKLVLNKRGEYAYSKLQESIARIFNELISQINPLAEDQIINDFVRIYDDAQYFTKLVSDIFLYMDKNFIQLKKHKTIKSLCNEQFKIRCFEQDPKLYNGLLNSMLSAIRNDRNNIPIEKYKLKSALQILIDINSKQIIKQTQQYNSQVEYELNDELYKQFFERKLISETNKYYREESQRLIEQFSISEYIVRIEQRYHEEQERVKQYLPKCSWQKSVDSFIKTCITQQSNYVACTGANGLYTFLENDQLDCVNRVYSLFILNDEAIDTFTNTMVKYIQDSGAQLFMNQNDATLNGIIELYEKMMNIKTGLQQLGTTEQTYKCTKSILNAFESIVNQDSFIMVELNKYFDILMKRHMQPDEEITKTMDKGFSIFKLLLNKDQFELMYRKFLCIRLLEGLSLSNDHEKLMINRVKIECGAILTQRMETMFNDLHRSKCESVEFRKFIDQYPPKKNQEIIDFEIMVLTAGQWPLTEPQSLHINDELTFWKSQFENNFMIRNPKRKLAWHYNLGFVNLRATFDAQNKKEFICSIIQASTLLLFNTQKQYNVQQLINQFNSDSQQIIAELMPLIQVGLLLTNTSDLSSPDGIIQLNQKFTHRSYKIKLVIKRNQQLLFSSKKQGSNAKDSQGSQVLDREVILDRKIYIESLVVRIMKARKQLDHKDLFYEIDKDNKNRHFVPDVVLFKECIESLIQRDYLCRLDGQLSTYVYKA